MKTYCTNSSCPKAETCIRYQQMFCAREKYLTILNPTYTTGGDNCQYFQLNEKTRFGKGFKAVLGTLPRTVEDKFRTAMIRHYNRNKYFAMRRGEVLCTPSDQQFISALLTNLGFPTDTIFDEWVEEYDW